MPNFAPAEPSDPLTISKVPPAQRRRRPRRIVFAAVAAVSLICGLLAAANLPATWYADRHAGEFTNGCAQLDGTTVTLDAFAVPRAATGNLSGIRGHVDRASIGGLRIDDITADIPAATLSAWRIALGSRRITVRRARITATITPTDLTAFLQAKGLPVTVGVDPSQPIILIGVDLVPRQLPLAVSADSGAIAIRPVPLPAGLSPKGISRLIRLPGVNVTSVDVAHDALIIHATVSGDPATPTCALQQMFTTSGLLSGLISGFAP